MSRKGGYGGPDKILLAVGRTDASKLGALSDGETGHVCVFGSDLEWEEVHSYKSLLRDSHRHQFTEVAA